eukprot:Colp12_sorted_trinity150504_noHs@32880
MLFIDAPANVGFSYAVDPNDINSNNDITAEDNYAVLQQFALEFPEYSHLPLILSGESYAGAYIPTLLSKILDGPAAGLRKVLRGIFLGNPVMSCDEWKKTADNIEVELYYWHGLIPLDLYTAWKAAGCESAESSPMCKKLLADIEEAKGPITNDNLYEDKCVGNATLAVSENEGPCITVGTLRNKYLNRADVQSSIGARATQWEECVGEERLNYTSLWPSMLPYYEHAFAVAPHLDILIYSGDVDIATVPTAYTSLCLSKLNRPLREKWRQWKVGANTAGYVEVRDGYTFVTVKGAGHEVPEYGPTAAFRLFERYLLRQRI